MAETREERGPARREAGGAREDRPPKKVEPKPAGTMGHGEPQIVGAIRSFRAFAQFLKGSEALIGNVTFCKNGVAIGPAAPTNPLGVAAIMVEAPLEACTFTLTAELDAPRLTAQEVIVLPKAELPEEYVETWNNPVPERDPETGRNLIPVILYSNKGRPIKNVEVHLLDAKTATSPPIPVVPPVLTDEVGRVVFDITVTEAEKTRDVLVIVPARAGLSKKIVLVGPAKKPHQWTPFPG